MTKPEFVRLSLRVGRAAMEAKIRELTKHPCAFLATYTTDELIGVLWAFHCLFPPKES